jgi:hypothetical protein
MENYTLKSTALLQKEIEQLTASNKELVEALEECQSVFKRLADEGNYPHFMMQENGGEGFLFITKALNNAKLINP